MTVILKRRAGHCESCKEKPAEYEISANKEEWSGPFRLCQRCMLSIVRNNEYIRSVVMLQGGAQE